MVLLGDGTYHADPHPGAYISVYLYVYRQIGLTRRFVNIDVYIYIPTPTSLSIYMVPLFLSRKSNASQQAAAVSPMSISAPRVNPICIYLYMCVCKYTYTPMYIYLYISVLSSFLGNLMLSTRQQPFLCIARALAPPGLRSRFTRSISIYLSPYLYLYILPHFYE